MGPTHHFVPMFPCRARRVIALVAELEEQHATTKGVAVVALRSRLVAEHRVLDPVDFVVVIAGLVFLGPLGS